MIVRIVNRIWLATRSGKVHAAHYLSAGVILHALTVIELLIIMIVVDATQGHPLQLPALFTLGLIPLFTQLDARSRYQEFKQVRDQLMRYGADVRIFKPLASSRCQRDAALAAARQQGCEASCRAFFSAAGHRWYHLLPNFLTSHPRILASKRFWRTTFFAPTYYPGPRGLLR